jgi:voltage-gated potassium channel
VLSETDSAASIAERLAASMFYLSLLFLLLLAGLVVAWVDVLPEPVAEEAANVSTAAATPSFSNFWQYPALLTGYLFLWAMLAIWPIFLMEPIYVRWQSRNAGRSRSHRQGQDWICAVCPPLRIGKSIPEMGGEIWLPRFGWHPAGKPLHKALERVFSKPMLIIAMLILPVLVIEFRYQDLLQSTLWLRLLLSVSMGLIWCAFAVEFILMVSSTKKKLLYVKKNWIDLAIILLPLVSFLRSLKIVRAAKLAKFAKVQQLTKMGRVYRMRGLLAKTVRAFLVLELVHRIFKTSPEKRLEQLLAQAEDKEDELRELQQRITAVRAQMESESAESESAESENTESEKVEPESSVVAATD